MLSSRSTSADIVPRASIIIVNWNGRHHLATCLDSLAAQTCRDFEVILVDNGSTDGSAEFVQEGYPWVRLVRLEENTGFAGGNNHGLAQTGGCYIVTLNNDTRVEPDWLEVLLRTADSRPRVGMVGCRICSFDDPDVIDSLGMVICRDGMARGRFRNRRWSSLQLPEVDAILFPSACAALYRRTMLEETGFFDDDFFAYAEDTDLGLRGRLAGWEAVLACSAVVHHKYSQTGGSFSPFKLHLVERNHYWVALKTFPQGWLWVLPWATMVRYAVQMQAICSGSGSGGEFRNSGSRARIGGALLRGMAEAMFGMPRMLGKRRRIMRSRKITTHAMTQLLRRHQVGFRELLDQVPADGDRK